MSDKNWIKDSVTNVLYEYIYQTGKEIGRRPFQPILADMPKYSEQELAFCMREILKGLSYLHENGLVHRSLKPRNLMYCDTQDGPLVKILDVSFTTILGRDTELEMVCGDPTFCAPEILLSHEYGTSVDMWALGVLLFIMVCGSEPFLRAEEGDTFRSILQAAFDLDMPEWATVTMHAKDVVKRLLVADPLIRMTAAQTLKHDWIIGVATPDLHLPASQYDLRKYNKRSAKKSEDEPCDNESIQDESPPQE
ncbi:hypothetical protein AAHC03_05875 [Spirometra sp. Aus1]